MNVKKEYTNGDITVVWDAGKCIHSGNCVKGLSKVFKPKEKPWIQLENASSEEIKETIKKCPSGALTYYKNEEETMSNNDTIKIETVKNGPLLIHGSCSVNKENGEVEIKDNVTAFCRCGSSNNKPYCDGEHRKIGFES